MGNDVFEFTLQSIFTAISKALGPGRMEGLPPYFKADCTEQGAGSPEGISDFVPTSISCDNYALSSTILNITPVTFVILHLLASAGK